MSTFRQEFMNVTQGQFTQLFVPMHVNKSYLWITIFRCKCKANCLNRVAQQNLAMKLQVFKTSNRGWGLRCINDVPRGSFVCIYAGHLLTEAKANEVRIYL